jgi:ABC-2 type transport system permease protein
MRAIDLAFKDFLQISRDWKTVFFLVLMPIGFTLLFGFVFGGSGGAEVDSRLPIGVVDQDGGRLSSPLIDLLSASDVVRAEVSTDLDDQKQQVADKKLAAVVVIPVGYSEKTLAGETPKLTLIADAGANAGISVQGEVQTAISRLQSAVRTAAISLQAYEQRQTFANDAARQSYFDEALTLSIMAWDTPPVSVTTTKSVVKQQEQKMENAFAHSSPGMMAQFAIAGLMSSAEILVLERKLRVMSRLLTTSIRRVEILLGHFLAMFTTIFVQFLLLATFGQIFLKLDYLSQPAATLMIIAATALFAASLGLLIGALAKSEEQVIIYTLFPMFILASLGGAWVPLELTSAAVQTVGHFTPVAWIMDGLKNILVRGQGVEAAVLPAGVLLAFAIGCFGLSAWKFKFE